MQLQESIDDGIAILSLRGQVDLHYAPVLRSLLQAKLNIRCPALILDLTEVSFIDSTGLAVIIEYLRDAHEFGGAFCIGGVNADVQGIFDIVRLSLVVGIYRTVAEAKDALQRGELPEQTPFCPTDESPPRKSSAVPTQSEAL